MNARFTAPQARNSTIMDSEQQTSFRRHHHRRKLYIHNNAAYVVDYSTVHVCAMDTTPQTGLPLCADTTQGKANEGKDEGRTRFSKSCAGSVRF